MIALIYLARQVALGSRTPRSATQIDLQNAYAASNHVILQTPSLASILARLRKKHAGFDEAEDVQVAHLTLTMAKIWNSTQLAFDNKQIDKETFVVWKRDVPSYISVYPSMIARLMAYLDYCLEARSYEIWSPVLKTSKQDQPT